MEKKYTYLQLSKMSTAIVGKNCVVKESFDGPGYTFVDDKKKRSPVQIFIAWEDGLYEGLSEEEKYAVMCGIDVHECLHQIYTPFASTEKIVNALPKNQQRIFAYFANILEDPAIEYMADQVVGGHLLKNLKFAIAHTYKVSPNIENANSAFGQYISALIQFGDMGILKGHFTFEEARETFVKTAPIFNQGVEEPNGKKRLKIAKEIFEIARPLWEKELKEQEEFMEELKNLLKSLGKDMDHMSSSSGSGDGEDGSGEDGGSSVKSKRRNVTIKKVSKEEFDELKKNAKSGSGSDDSGDITIYQCDEADSDGSEDSGESSSMDGTSGESGDQNNDSDNSSDSDFSNSSADSDNGNADGNSPSGESAVGKADESDNEGKKDNSSNEKTMDSAYGSSNNVDCKYNRQNNRSGEKVKNSAAPDGYDEGEVGFSEISEEEYSLSEEDIEYIREESKLFVQELEKEARNIEADDTPLDDTPIESPRLGKRSCKNKRVQFDGRDVSEMSDKYAEVLAKVNPVVSLLTTQLKKIFRDDTEAKVYRTSGKINAYRLNEKRGTAKVFERRRAPVGKSDMAVCIIVDESGSMWSDSKYVAARECCIALAEVFNNLNVPLYVFGFTADESGADCVHRHYITWKNTKNDRLKLLHLQARSNNLDGYSVRYAHSLLKKKKAQHKLLIVISDGQPAASNYWDGVADTSEAIRHARRDCSVLGVAVGNDSTDVLFSMYGKTFLHVSSVADLSVDLSKKIKDIVRAWK